MSDPLRVAFVTEGPTDYFVLRAAVRALLNGRDFEPTLIQPELDDNLVPQNSGGWGAVYRWCRQATEQAGGAAGKNPLFQLHDVVVMQVDADVARASYSDYKIRNPPNDLPCQRPCPPAVATTEALRAVLLGWLNESAVPNGMVFCTPSKSIETWVFVALQQDTPTTDIECRWDVSSRLRKYGLIKSSQKILEKYRANEDTIHASWPIVRKWCREAERFSIEFMATIPTA